MRTIDVLKYMLARAELEVPEGHQIVALNVPVDIVREIIDAQPEQQWIPCSKKLPEKDGEYLVTDDSGGAKWVVISQFIRCEDGSIYWDYANVIAWMPRPEPYGGEQE